MKISRITYVQFFQSFFPFNVSLIVSIMSKFAGTPKSLGVESIDKSVNNTAPTNCFPIMIFYNFLSALHKKLKFSIKDFFSKCDQIRSGFGHIYGRNS